MSAICFNIRIGFAGNRFVSASRTRPKRAEDKAVRAAIEHYFPAGMQSGQGEHFRVSLSDAKLFAVREESTGS